MTEKEIYYFTLLKEEVAQCFLAKKIVSALDYKLWKGNEIHLFQEDILQSVKATISEKWFYTYFKKETKKLPRIDMLNLLSSYIGYTNWIHFCNEKQVDKTTRVISKSKLRKPVKWKLGGLVLILLSFAFFSYLKLSAKNTFTFCFKDGNFSTPVKNLSIQVLLEKESPIQTKTDVNGCFVWETTEKQVRIVIASPYYKRDTIVRSIYKNHEEEVTLKNDDYSLILSYYSNANIKDWKKRRAELTALIADDALIYRIFKNSQAIEIYSKKEFINQLTLPTKVLKNIEILETQIKDNQLNVLKFWIKE